MTARDAIAPDIAPILSLKNPRYPETWPVVSLLSLSIVERVEDRIADWGLPMERLERELIGEARAHEARTLGTPPPTDVETMTHREAHAHANRIAGMFFTGIVNGRQS